MKKTSTTMTKELTVQAVEKEMNPMLTKANGIKIQGPKDMETASEFLSQLNLAKDKVEERLETITTPAKQVIKAAEAVWKPFIKAADAAIKNIRDKQSEYQTAEIKRAREEEAKIAARIGEGKGKLKIETAAKKFEEIEKPEAKIVTNSGSVGFREDKVFKVMNVTMLPAEYILPDEVKIRAAMKAGIELPGVAYDIKMVPINTR